MKAQRPNSFRIQAKVSSQAAFKKKAYITVFQECMFCDLF